MSGSHDFLTRKILDALPRWQGEFWNPTREKLIDEYCWYPDWYYSTDRNQQAAARPYVTMVDGEPFHYLPANPAETGNWRVLEDGSLQRVPNAPNGHWQFVARGFHDSLGAVIKHLHAGRIEEAGKYTGPLLHVIEDAGSSVHALEGVDGTDPMLLDRLLRPPSGRIQDMPGMVLRQDDAVDFECGSFRPTLLGTTIGETVFRLYSRYAAMVQANRLELVPMIQCHWRGEIEASREHVGRMNHRLCGVAVDLLYTLTCVATGRFQSTEVQALERVPLEDLQPIHRPYILPGYEADPLVHGNNLDAQGRRVSLRLIFPGGVRRFENGIGTGCHVEYVLAYDLPRGVYAHFRGFVGLHAELGVRGAFGVEIRLAGQTLFGQDCDEVHPTAKIDLPVSAGGMLELFVRDRTGDWANPDNHVVWAEPHLVRQPPPLDAGDQ